LQKPAISQTAIGPDTPTQDAVRNHPKKTLEQQLTGDVFLCESVGKLCLLAIEEITCQCIFKFVLSVNPVSVVIVHFIDENMINFTD
jgi:hypothetical protein